MYEELVKELRVKAGWLDPVEEVLLSQAADAIEELSGTVEAQKAQIITMAAEAEKTEFLENLRKSHCVVTDTEQEPKIELIAGWISVDERLPEPPQEADNGTR